MKYLKYPKEIIQLEYLFEKFFSNIESCLFRHENIFYFSSTVIFLKDSHNDFVKIFVRIYFEKVFNILFYYETCYLQHACVSDKANEYFSSMTMDVIDDHVRTILCLQSQLCIWC